MKVENVELELFIDYVNKRIHLLEKGRRTYNNNLPSVIGNEFQKKLIEQNSLLIDVMEFEWLCYCSNGLILLFNNRGLHLTARTDKKLYKPFLDALTI